MGADSPPAMLGGLFLVPKRERVLRCLRIIFYLENPDYFRNFDLNLLFMSLSFEDTKTAFAYKSDSELKNARFLFSTMAMDWLVKIGLAITPWVLKMGLPVRGLIKRTIFRQFVGGESLNETAPIADKLNQFGVGLILDYGVEGKEGEASYEEATETFKKVIRYAATRPNIPFMSVKMTGLARFALLEKLNGAAVYPEVIRGILPMEALSRQEQEEWSRVEQRLEAICQVAQDGNIGVLIDAEESWIQHPVDALVTKMMLKFNHTRPVIFNTAQLYRHDRLQYIKDSNDFAKASYFTTGIKLVRGAYMEKERERADKLAYTDPINITKEATDRDFNLAVEYCLDPVNNIFSVVGSHNEFSNRHAVDVMKRYGMEPDTSKVYFSQLFGMSDNITFNLAKEGCNVTKYLPFGPLKDVIPYLMRRAQENSSVSGQTGRELSLIKKEIKRRSL